MHQEKLKERLQTDIDDHAEYLTTIATSLPKAHLVAFGKSSIELATDTESLYMPSSYASTSDESVVLRPPPCPEEAQDGDPFGCPICFSVIEAKTEHS